MLVCAQARRTVWERLIWTAEDGCLTGAEGGAQLEFHIGDELAEERGHHWDHLRQLHTRLADLKGRLHGATANLVKPRTFKSSTTWGAYRRGGWEWEHLLGGGATRGADGRGHFHEIVVYGLDGSGHGEPRRGGWKAGRGREIW